MCQTQLNYKRIWPGGLSSVLRDVREKPFNTCLMKFGSVKSEVSQEPAVLIESRILMPNEAGKGERGELVLTRLSTLIMGITA